MNLSNTNAVAESVVVDHERLDRFVDSINANFMKLPTMGSFAQLSNAKFEEMIPTVAWHIMLINSADSSYLGTDEERMIVNTHLWKHFHIEEFVNEADKRDQLPYLEELCLRFDEGVYRSISHQFATIEGIEQCFGTSITGVTRRRGAQNETLVQAQKQADQIQEFDSPPANAEYLLYVLMPPKDRERILGNMELEFEGAIERFGVRRARLFYWLRVSQEIGGAFGKWCRRSKAGMTVLRFLGEVISMVLKNQGS